MSISSTSSIKMVVHNNKLEFEEMRRRLLETEKKLRNLNKFEEQMQSGTSLTFSSSVEQRALLCFQKRGLQIDQGKSKTSPNLGQGSAELLCDDEMLNNVTSIQKRCQSPAMGENSFDSECSLCTTDHLSVTNKYERKLLSQNQRLLSEVERLVDELYTLKVKIGSLEKYEVLGMMVPELEDRIEGLLADNEAQDKALSEAEIHNHEGSKVNENLHSTIQRMENEMEKLRNEVELLKATSLDAECHRDATLQNLEEARTALETYQYCMSEKLRKMESIERDLRDKCAEVTKERDDVIEQLSDMQQSLNSQETQINRLFNDLEMEESRKNELDKEKKKLQEQFDLLALKINKYEFETKNIKAVKKEKQLLEAELCEHRSMAQEIAELLMLVQHNHNKNVLHDEVDELGINNMKNEITMWDMKTEDPTAAELNVNNSGNFDNINSNGLGCEGGVSMMGELRNLFVNMDGEIQRLRYDLKQRDADDKTYQNLHDELKVLMERVESGVTANQELSCMVCTLEEDKRNLLMKLNEFQQTIAERERQIQLLDTRLNERNHQVVCLQEDNNDKAESLCTLRKHFEAMESRLHTHGSGQNQASEQLQSAIIKIQEMEDAAVKREQTIYNLNEQVVKLNKELRAIQQKMDKKSECLTQQIYEYERQTEQLSGENENLRGKLANTLKSSEEIRRQIQTRDSQNLAMDAQLEELKMTLEEKEKLHIKLLESYQQKMVKANEQTKSLENALVLCRNEVKMHMDTMEKIKNHFECEIMKRDGCIKHMKEELRKCGEDLKCRLNESCLLEQTNGDLQTKLANAYIQIKGVEQNACLLTDKLKNAENIMLKDKACYMKENEEMERRLTQALNGLQCAQEEINKFKTALSEKSGMVDCLQGEKNSLCRDLTKCKEVACTLQDKLSKMEKDNQELCRQLQQKMDCIRDMEVAICAKDQETKRCQRCLDELQDKIKRMISDQGSNTGATATLQDKIKACREELFVSSKKLIDAEEALKRREMEIQDKCETIRSLNGTLEELSCRLQDRISRVDELEKAIDNLNKDIEKRMKRVDEQLKKYECELCDKAKQIADIDDYLGRCQRNLSEKCNEACVLEQRNNRLQADLCACNAKAKECDDARECLAKALAEQRAETAEIAQELRATREQLQQKHQESMDNQQNLCCSNREWEKCRRDCDDLRNTLQQRECELQHLSEEKNCLVSKVAHLTCRLESETCQLENQQAEMKCRLEKENEALRIFQTEIEENNACLLQKLGTCQRQLAQVEKCCTQKIDCMNREIADLASKLGDREDQITQCKDTLAIRDSEIMRLKLKLCNTDNTSCNNSLEDWNCKTNNNTDQDELGIPVLLTPSRHLSFIKLTNGVTGGRIIDHSDMIVPKVQGQFKSGVM